MEVEAISTTLVSQALHTLASIRGKEERHVNIVTPLQAMPVCNDFMADDITHINTADTDRRRNNQGCVDTAGNVYDKRTRGNRYGAIDASRAPDAKGSRQDRAPADHASSSSSKRTRQPDLGNDTEKSWSDCWIRPRMYVGPPSVQDFNGASDKAHLNEFQRHAMTLTGGHRLALVRGPPGTGKTQLSAAVIDAWARNLSKDEIFIAAGPSNTATDNLLDRIAHIEGRDYDIGRLREGSSAFDRRCVEFSLTDQARRIAGRDAKKAVINKVVRQATTERRHPVIFITYMKSAEHNGTNPLFIPADEAGQATEPTSAVGSAPSQRH